MDLDWGKILNISKCSVFLDVLDECNLLLLFFLSYVLNDLKLNMILWFIWLNVEWIILNLFLELIKRDCKLFIKMFFVLGFDWSREG